MPFPPRRGNVDPDAEAAFGGPPRNKKGKRRKKGKGKGKKPAGSPLGLAMRAAAGAPAAR